MLSAKPDRRRFHALAREYTVIPVWRELLADLTTPVAAFTRIVGDQPGFLLETVEHADRWGRWSFMGAGPRATLVLRDGSSRSPVSCRHPYPPTTGCSPPSRRCSRCAGRRRFQTSRRLHGGLVGYLGYDVVREVERLPADPSR